MNKTLGVPNLVSAKRQQLMVVQRDAPIPSKLRQFFSPIFTFFPFDTGKLSFRLWPGGGQAKGPVNLGRSHGGIIITPELSLSIAAVWACVWRYANTVMSLPLCLYRRSEDGSTIVEERQHPLYRILHYVPNQDMSSAKFMQALVASMMTWGVCYAKKLRIKDRLVGLRPLRPEYVTAYLTDEGRLRYRYWPLGMPAQDINEDLAAEDVFVVIDRSMDGYTGLSRIQYAANALSLSLAGDRAATLSYKNGLRASGILTIAQWLKPEQREAYRNIVNQFVGTGDGTEDDKQFGVMVAENATKFEPLSLKPVDVELLSSRKYSFEEICSWYDVPPILVHHSQAGQTMWGTGVEQIILGWLKLGLGPLLKTFEQEIYRQLLTPEEQGAGLYAAFKLDELLRGDSAARASFLSTMTQNGVYTRNEGRAMENLPRSDEANADKLTVQTALSPIEKLGMQQPPSPSISAPGARSAPEIHVHAPSVLGQSADDRFELLSAKIDSLFNRPIPTWEQIPIRGIDGRIERIQLKPVDPSADGFQLLTSKIDSLFNKPMPTWEQTPIRNADGRIERVLLKPIQEK